MINRLRKTLNDIFSPGGLRRHPLLCVAMLLILALVVFGLATRPL